MTEQEDSINILTDIGKQVFKSISEGDFPSLELPNRGTDNIVYDKERNRFVLGESTVIRASSNLRQVKSFAQLLWLASFAKNLLKTERTSSLRDLYYSGEAFGIEFKDQAESDRLISDLECLTGLPRESFGVFPEEHSSVYGKVTMQYTVPGYEGREVDLTVSPDGLPIGPALMTAKPIDSDADKIVAVESGGMFSRLIETKAWKKFNAVIVQLGGQAPRSTRRLMKRLHDELGMPVYIFTDGDPWGMHIARVIISGSANAAHIDGLAIPNAKWIGVTPADIKKHSLPTEPMSSADLKRLDELSNDARYNEPEWQEYIREFKDLRMKAEQQAFSRYGMDYVVDTYLPEKLQS
ncbi:MAG: DNA topoisomerase IV subunit A [Candidatus Thorarchaeota archaeon]|jgi:DNA topoisomerase-6 subunit A